MEGPDPVDVRSMFIFAYYLSRISLVGSSLELEQSSYELDEFDGSCKASITFSDLDSSTGSLGFCSSLTSAETSFSMGVSARSSSGYRDGTLGYWIILGDSIECDVLGRLRTPVNWDWFATVSRC